MNLYRGQIMLAIAAVLCVMSVACVIGYFRSGQNMDNPLVFLLFAIGCLTFIVAATLGALAYTHWVPKWERDEKRTGHVLGEKEKSDA